MVSASDLGLVQPVVFGSIIAMHSTFSVNSVRNESVSTNSSELDAEEGARN